MAKKMTKLGNSLAVIIDKAFLKLYGITEKTEVEFIPTKDGLMIRPVKKEKTKKTPRDLDEIAEKIMEKYEKAFKKLAE